MAIDISKWDAAQRSVRYRCDINESPFIFAMIIGDEIKVNSDGSMSARLIAYDPKWATGHFKPDQWIEHGGRRNQFHFINKPQAILDLEATLAKAEAEEKEKEADLKRRIAEAAAASKSSDEVSFDEPPVQRQSAVKASRLR